MSTPTVASDAQSVDDVLASIRKLVSDEAQVQTNEVARQALAEESDAPLVLTPELKVPNKGSDEPLVLKSPVATPDDEPDAMNISESSETHETAPFHDEVALRGIVSEMIRDELQGELGNRITRNVRRMVRREIEAALKEQSLI